MWNDVEKYIVGLENAYLDTSFTLEMDDIQMKEIIKGHKAENILFGSDFPWQRQAESLKKIKSLGLTKKEEESIFFQNAEELLF